MTMQIATLEAEANTKVHALESTVTELRGHNEEANLKATQQL